MSEKLKRKQQDRELKWHEIPDHQNPPYKQAEAGEWNNFMKFKEF